MGTVGVQIFRDKVEALPAEDAAAHAWCSTLLGTDVRLVHLDDPATRRPVDPAYALPGETVSFADGFPLLLTTTASLDALNSLIARGEHAHEGPLPMDRFRPNLVVSGTEPWAEDRWSRIAVGEVVLRVAKPCGRCVVTTTDQGTADRGAEPCTASAGTVASTASWSSGRIWSPSARARSGSEIRCESPSDVRPFVRTGAGGRGQGAGVKDQPSAFRARCSGFGQTTR